ncbi:MAG: hypothetical protein IPL46_12270 [Saprospiraceae bacterium]|nr:hypothetical protein [Saprospiraceae bacterium]
MSYSDDCETPHTTLFPCQEKGYIPESENVLFHTNLLAPQSSDAIYFEAPPEPGNYAYVCTFPGHALIMRGVLKVVPPQ